MLTSPRVIDILDPISGLVSAVDAGERRTFVRWRDGAVRLLDDKLAEIAQRETEDALIVADENFDSSERIVLPIDFGDEGEIEKVTPLGSGNVAIGAWTPSGRLTLVVHLVDE